MPRGEIDVAVARRDRAWDDLASLPLRGTAIDDKVRSQVEELFLAAHKVATVSGEQSSGYRRPARPSYGLSYRGQLALTDSRAEVKKETEPTPISFKGISDTELLNRAQAGTTLEGLRARAEWLMRRGVGFMAKAKISESFHDLVETALADTAFYGGTYGQNRNVQAERRARAAVIAARFVNKQIAVLDKETEAVKKAVEPQRQSPSTTPRRSYFLNW